jgi:hypothetical protein
MGEEVRKDLALDTELIVEVLKAIDQKVEIAFEEGNSTERNKWIIAGAYISISYVLSLRGNEGFMMDIKELLKNWSMKKGLVWIVLSGILKGESVPELHQLRSVPKTDSGVEIWVWVNRLVFVHDQAGRVEGPAICDEEGYLLSFPAMNELFWQVLEEVFLEDSNLFPKAIATVDDIPEKINIYRSLRRSSDSRAIKMGVNETDIQIVARWKKKHASKGKAPSEAMHINYAEQELLNECFQRYTQKM